ncbi:MAG: multiheme c-type cytochrome [Planctomycetota bacterium]|jgi:formate-dependent nitrite reductase cytochrome c552 subunit
MKARLAMTLGIASISMVAIGLWLGSAAPAVAGDTAVMTAVAATLPAMGGEGAAYVGSKKCKKCHMKQNKSWKAGKKAKALDVLLPGQATEVKAKFDLDSSTDYSKDETCLACHTTGYGHEGGYFMPDPADEKAVKKAKKLAGVGCESCHGPGGEYVKLFDEIMKSKRTYKVEEVYAAGLRKIDEATCTGCHNEKSPTYDPAKPFNFATMKDKGAHEHFPLKQRED